MNPTQLKCNHENFRADCRVNRLEDTGRFVAELNITCDQCGLPFHFPGVPYGMQNGGPTSSMDRVELRTPIIPGPAALPKEFKAAFEMPDTRGRN